MNNNEWIEIGKIVAPQGIKGELRVNPSSDFPERFEQPGQRWLKSPAQAQPQAVELLRGSQIPGKNLYIIALQGVEDRSQAEALRGSTLLVPFSDRPQLAADEYHVSDLINLEVYHQNTGENIGIVINVFTAGNDLLEVQLHQQLLMPEIVDIDLSKVNRKSKIAKLKSKKPKPLTTLIPFVKEIVPVVDLKNKRLEINPPPGLLETNLPSKLEGQ